MILFVTECQVIDWQTICSCTIFYLHFKALAIFNAGVIQTKQSSQYYMSPLCCVALSPQACVNVQVWQEYMILYLQKTHLLHDTDATAGFHQTAFSIAVLLVTNRLFPAVGWCMESTDNKQVFMVIMECATFCNILAFWCVFMCFWTTVAFHLYSEVDRH